MTDIYYGNVFKNNEGKGKAVLQGTINIDGTEYFVDLFPATDRDTGEPKLTRDGQKFYNVRLKVKGAAPQASPKKVPTHVDDDLDDQIPFN